MEIFGKVLSGDDAKEFCKLSKKDKKAWILKYTNQRNTEMIKEFIDNPPQTKKGGCGCGCK